MAVGAALMAGCAPGGDFPAVDAGVARKEARKQRAVAEFERKRKSGPPLLPDERADK